MTKPKNYPAKSRTKNRSKVDPGNLSIGHGHTSDVATPPISQTDIEQGRAEDARYNVNNVN